MVWRLRACLSEHPTRHHRAASSGGNSYTCVSWGTLHASFGASGTRVFEVYVLLLADNDVVLKLCVFDLFEEGLQALDCERDHIRVLPTAIYKMRDLRKRDRSRAQYGEQGLDRTIEVLGSLQVVDGAVSPDLQEQLLNHHWIDKGEAVLVCAATEMESAFIATGDKRFIEAFGGAQDLQNVRAVLNGRIWCLEAVILKIIDRFGFRYCDERMGPVVGALDVDKYIKMVWRNGEGQVREGLLSQIRDFQAKCPGLLVPTQFDVG